MGSPIKEPEEEPVEVPDTGYQILDQAAELLCYRETYDLDLVQTATLDVMLAELLTVLWNRAEEIADSQPVPGKITESSLEGMLTGYKQAAELARYLVNVLPPAPTPGGEPTC